MHIFVFFKKRHAYAWCHGGQQASCCLDLSLGAYKMNTTMNSAKEQGA
jgi:hypothetical protein